MDHFPSGRALRVLCMYVGECRYAWGCIGPFSCAEAREGDEVQGRVGARDWEVQCQDPSLGGSTV